MYEYKFVRIGLSSSVGLFTTTAVAKDDYHRIIQQHAEAGWRLVQVFDPSTFGYGRAEYFEIIFERLLKPA